MCCYIFMISFLKLKFEKAWHRYSKANWEQMDNVHDLER